MTSDCAGTYYTVKTIYSVESMESRGLGPIC